MAFISNLVNPNMSTQTSTPSGATKGSLLTFNKPFQPPQPTISGGQVTPTQVKPPATQTITSQPTNQSAQPKAQPPAGVPGAISGLFPQTVGGLAQIGTGQASRPVAQSTGALQSLAADRVGQGSYQDISGNWYDAQGNPISSSQANVRQTQGLLQGFATGQTPQVTAAQQEYNKFAQANPYMLAAQYNPNVAADVASGRAGLLGQIFSQELAAKQKAVENALTGQGQQIGAAGTAGSQALTGAGQQITAAQAAGQLGVSQQQAQTSALQAAAGQAAPVTQFGFLTSPLTGQSISPAGTASTLPFQGGFIQGQQQAGQNAALMNSANIQAKGIEGTIQQYLQANPDLNPSPAAVGNAFLQFIQGKQLGDPKYQTLANYLNEYVSTLAPILGVGGDTTNLKTEIAQSFINAQASGQSIAQVLTNMGQLADQKLQNLMSAGQGGGQVAGGTPQGGTPTSFGTEW